MDLLKAVNIEIAKVADGELRKIAKALSQSDEYISGDGTTTSEYLLRAVKAWSETRARLNSAPDWISDE